MSISFKVVVALFIGALLGSLIGDIVQQKLIFSIYYADNIGRRFTLSGAICSVLGATTAVAFVLWKSKLEYLAARLAHIGAAWGLVWLSTDSDSQLFHWWNFKPENHHSFEYWNVARNPYHDVLADILIFNGVPLLWSISLVWWGLKLLIKQHSKSRNQPMEQLETTFL